MRSFLPQHLSFTLLQVQKTHSATNQYYLHQTKLTRSTLPCWTIVPMSASTLKRTSKYNQLKKLQIRLIKFWPGWFYKKRVKLLEFAYNMNTSKPQSSNISQPIITMFYVEINFPRRKISAAQLFFHCIIIMSDFLQYI